jgi:hypothetical protein
MKYVLSQDGLNRFGLNAHDVLGLTPFNGDKITTLHGDGEQSFNEKIKELSDKYNLSVYFLPKIRIETLYNDFGIMDYQLSAKTIINSIFNPDSTLTKDFLPIKKFNGSVLPFKNLKYKGPSDSHDFGYYLDIQLNSGSGEQNYNILMTYMIYVWYNEFDFENSHWKKPPCLYINNERFWRLHPGRARMQYVEFSDTTASLFLILNDKSVLTEEYFKDAIDISDVSTLKDIVMNINPDFIDVDFYLQDDNGIVDLWYIELDEHKKSSNGEKFNLFFGNKLTVEFCDNTLYYNSEPIMYVKDDKLFFYKSEPKFKI